MFNMSVQSKIDYDVSTYRYHRKAEPAENLKLKVLAGSVIGTAIPLAFFAKKQKTYISKINFGLKEMLLTGLGSITGGVISGISFDKKEYKRQKIHEGIFQFLNTSIPALLTGAFISAIDRTKYAKNNFAKIIMILTGLFGGMQTAVCLSNFINDPYDKVPDRKLTAKDMLANADDAFGALVLAKIPVKIPSEKILPVIYGWCGYRAGSSN